MAATLETRTQFTVVVGTFTATGETLELALRGVLDPVLLELATRQRQVEALTEIRDLIESELAAI